MAHTGGKPALCRSMHNSPLRRAFSYLQLVRVTYRFNFPELPDSSNQLSTESWLLTYSVIPDNSNIRYKKSRSQAQLDRR